MGGNSSQIAALETDPEVQSVVSNYLLTPSQVSSLHSFYSKAAKPFGGTLKVDNFPTVLRETSTVFLFRLFTFKELQTDSEVPFPLFLSIITEFCCFTEPQMVEFAFQSFDKDGSGFISEQEIKDFIDEMDKSTSDFPKAAKKALQIFDSDGSGSIDYDEFAEMNLRYPHLLWPAFRLQNRIQEMTLGIATWKKVNQRMKEKGKLQKKFGPRPFCPLCFCLPRPVLNVKKTKTFMGLHTTKGGLGTTRKPASAAAMMTMKAKHGMPAVLNRRQSVAPPGAAHGAPHGAPHGIHRKASMAGTAHHGNGIATIAVHHGSGNTSHRGSVPNIHRQTTHFPHLPPADVIASHAHPHANHHHNNKNHPHFEGHEEDEVGDLPINSTALHRKQSMATSALHPIESQNGSQSSPHHVNFSSSITDDMPRKTSNSVAAPGLGRQGTTTRGRSNSTADHTRPTPLRRTKTNAQSHGSGLPGQLEEPEDT